MVLKQNKILFSLTAPHLILMCTTVNASLVFQTILQYR